MGVLSDSDGTRYPSAAGEAVVVVEWKLCPAHCGGRGRKPCSPFGDSGGFARAIRVPKRIRSYMKKLKRERKEEDMWRREIRRVAS